MVIDTSALVAILTGEDGYVALEDAIDSASARFIAVASAFEASIVLESRFGDQGTHELDLLIGRLGIEVVPLDLDQLEWARHAYRSYGKRRHQAGLNFGDCFAYALAKSRREPLLYRGGDFSKTDIVSAT
jgi:ribonuclease VapC